MVTEHLQISARTAELHFPMENNYLINIHYVDFQNIFSKPNRLRLSLILG